MSPAPRPGPGRARRLLIAAVFVLASVLAVAIVGPGFVDWNMFRDELAAQLKAATGGDFVIEGDLRFRLAPTPVLSAQAVRIANPPGSPVRDLLRMRAIAVEVAVVPLTSGRLQVRSLQLDEPELVLRRQGSALRMLGGGLAGSTALGERLPLSVQLDRVSVKNGVLALIDGDGGRVDRLSGIDATISARSIAGPYRATGRFLAQDAPIDFELSLGEIAAGRGVPLNLTLTLRGGVGRAELAASLFAAPETSRMTGTLKSSARDLGAVIAVLTKSADNGFLAGEASLDASFSATDTSLKIAESRFRWGDMTGGGAIELPLEGRGGSMALSVGRIDIDALLARATAIAERRRRTPDPVAAFAVPDFLPETFDLRADALTWRGGILRQTRLEGSIEPGRIALKRGRSLLPGGTDLSLQGAIEARSGLPVFEGQGEAASDNLRALIEWAGVNTSALPAGRLRRLDAQSAVTLRLPWGQTPAAVTLTGLDAAFDVSRIRGGIAAELRRRPALGVGVSIDRLELDAYVPSGAHALPPLAALDGFDANVQLVAGTLTYRGQALSGVKFDGTLEGGVLEIREAGIDRVAGADLHLFGRVSGLGARPTFDVNLLGRAPNPSALFALAGVDLPEELKELSFDGRANGGLDRLSFEAELDADGGKLQAKGAAIGLDRQPRYEATVALRHPSHARVAQLLGLPAAGDLGPVSLDLAWGASGRNSIKAALDLGPASLDLDGTLDGFGGASPAGSFTVTATHPDLAALLRTLAPGAATGRLEGPARVTGKLLTAPEGFAFNGIEGTLGRIGFVGDIEWMVDGPRPRLVAGLKLSESALEDVFALAALGRAQPASEGRWSRAPFELPGAGSLDARITLAAPAATFGPWRIEQPRATVALTGRALALEELNANAYAGTLKLSARIEQSSTQRLEIDLSLDGADAALFTDAARGGAGEGLVGALAELIYPAAAGLASGRLSASVAAKAEGASAAAMAATISGRAKLSLAGATLDRFDLCAVAKGVGANGADGLDALLAQASLSGGTKIKDAVAELSIEGGVARLPDLALAADCGEIVVGGTVDLVRFTQDLRAVAKLADVPGFPGLELKQTGPLDAPAVAIANAEALVRYLAALRPAAPVAPPPPAPPPQAAPAAQAPAPPPAQQPPRAPAPTAPAAPPRPTPPRPATQPQTPPAPAQQPAPPADPFRGILDNLLRP